MKSSFLLLSRVFDEIFTFEKQAPICTLGVGGKPLEMGCCCCFKGSPLRLPEFSMPVGDDLLADLSRRRGGALGEVLDPSSEKETQEIILLPDFPPHLQGVPTSHKRQKICLHSSFRTPFNLTIFFAQKISNFANLTFSFYKFLAKSC